MSLFVEKYLTRHYHVSASSNCWHEDRHQNVGSVFLSCRAASCPVTPYLSVILIPAIRVWRLRTADGEFNALLIARGRRVRWRITSLGKIEIQYTLVRWAEARLRESPTPVTSHLHTKIIPLNFSPSLKLQEEGNKRGKRGREIENEDATELQRGPKSTSEFSMNFHVPLPPCSVVVARHCLASVFRDSYIERNVRFELKGKIENENRAISRELLS